MRHINSATHLLGDKTTVMVKNSHQRPTNVSFRKMLSPENRSEPILLGIIQSTALKTLIETRSSTLATVASTHFLKLVLTLKV